MIIIKLQRKIIERHDRADQNVIVEIAIVRGINIAFVCEDVGRPDSRIKEAFFTVEKRVFDSIIYETHAKA